MFNLHRQPYLDADTGANLGGGGAPLEEVGQQAEVTQQNTTEGQQQATEQMFKLKYNHEEKEIPYSQAVELAQKGMNYEKAVEKARQEASQQARDAYIAEQGYVWQGKQITTEAEYQQAMRESELVEKYKNQGLPDEVVNELVESRNFREKYQSQQQATEKQQAEQKMYQEFMDAYPELKPEQIPPEVWQEVQKGRNLLDAYVRHENAQLKKQLGEFQAKEQAAQANQANALTSTGSVKGQGAPGTGFISKDVFEANKSDQSWMMKNYDQIKSSMSKWH